MEAADRWSCIVYSRRGPRLYLEQRRDHEAITAYDVETGREAWAFAYPALFDEILGGAGPRATPVYREGLVYSLGANGDLYCVSAKTGKPRWSKNILTDNGAHNPQWGMAGSPLIVDGMVVVTPGGAPGKSVVAYDRLSGAPVWRALDDTVGYTSPMLATLAGRRQIVWISAQRAVGTGTGRWRDFVGIRVSGCTDGNELLAACDRG